MKKYLGLILPAILVFAAPLFAQRTALFPRFASGADGSGGVWKSQFFFTNQGISAVTGITVSFIDKNGNPASVVTNLGTNSSFAFDLGAGASKTIQVTPGSTMVDGHVEIDYPDFISPVRASEVFRYELNGAVLVEVGTPQQELGDHFSFSATMNQADHVYTAVALTNPTSDNQTFVVDLIDTNGNLVATKTVPMDAGTQLAGYIDQDWLFPQLNNTDFSGTISVSSQFGAGVLTLRQDKDAFGAVATDGGPVIGPFALTGTPISEVEPNDTDLTANHITGSQIVSGSIGAAQDADVFYFTGKKGQIVTIFSDTQGTSSVLDSVLGVYDSDLNQLAYNDQNGLAPGLYPENDSFIQMVIPADGIYYVMIWDFWDGGAPTGYEYKLYFNLP